MIEKETGGDLEKLFVEILKVVEPFIVSCRGDLMTRHRYDAVFKHNLLIQSILHLQCERDEKDVIYPKQVESDALDLYEVGLYVISLLLYSSR